MEEKKFKKPDEAALRRMTPRSVEALLETLVEKRSKLVVNIDEEIAYYREWLANHTTEGMNA